MPAKTPAKQSRRPLLAVNVGNTHVMLGLYEGERLRHTWRIRSEPSRTEDEYRLLIGALLAEANPAVRRVAGCIIGSVVPSLTQRLAPALRLLLNSDPMLLSHDLDLGLRNAYSRPEQVGADRLANAVGGVARYGAPLLVVDSGTATTFDVVSREPAYLGGIILPGLDMSAEALFQKTSLLPRIAIEPPSRVIGRSTVDAIASGLVWGTVGAVDRLIEQVREEMGEPRCRVVATGGYAEILARLSRHISKADADLTLFGLLCIWRRNR